MGLDLIPLNFPPGCRPGGGSPWQGGLFGRGGLLGGGVSLEGGSPWQRGVSLPGVLLAGGLPDGGGVTEYPNYCGRIQYSITMVIGQHFQS